MKKSILFALLAIFSIPVISTSVIAETSAEQFFATLKSLCGEEFIGETIYPQDPNHDFANKELVMTVSVCDKNQVKIPFRVGKDTSRTWIFTLSDKGLLFKHDHRYKDGTPHKITNYGGWANKEGNALSQSFPADKETHLLVPEGKTNIWNVSYEPKTKVFTYFLTRHGKPRYKAKFKPIKSNVSK